MGVVGDSLFSLIDMVRRALTRTDVLVVTGGVSMGEKDLLKEVFPAFQRLSPRVGSFPPALPTQQNLCSPSPAIRSPPSSRPIFLCCPNYLRRIAGMDSDWDNARIRVKIAQAIGPLDARPEYRRARLVRLSSVSADGLAFAQCIGGSQCSSRLCSALSANLLLELPPRDERHETMAEGETVTALGEFLVLRPSSVLHRHRKSPWPAVPITLACQIVQEQFEDAIDKLRHIEQKEANAPELLGAVLAESVHALEPVPDFRASIKDGYAVIASDGVGPRRVVAVSTAGTDCDARGMGVGECVRVTTGARVPLGADAVMQVEDTRVLEHNGEEELVVEIGKQPLEGQDIREPGSDVTKGELLLKKGTVLNAAEIGVIALSGAKKVCIYERSVPVSVLSTGDELIDFYSPDDRPRRVGAVMDTNRPVLISFLRSNGFRPVDMGVVGDRDELQQAKAWSNLSATYTLLLDFDNAIDCANNVLAHLHCATRGVNESYDEEQLAKYLERSVECFEMHLAIARERQDRVLCGLGLGNLGNAYFYLGEYELSIEQHEKRIELAKELGDQASVRRSYSNIGNAYALLGDYENSAKFYRLALELACEMNIPELVNQLNDDLENVCHILAKEGKKFDDLPTKQFADVTYTSGGVNSSFGTESTNLCLSDVTNLDEQTDRDDIFDQIARLNGKRIVDQLADFKPTSRDASSLKDSASNGCRFSFTKKRIGNMMKSLSNLKKIGTGTTPKRGGNQQGYDPATTSADNRPKSTSSLKGGLGKMTKSEIKLEF
uniref:Molybdopterin molybdenumtransferase n=1 Tax=Globodera pallida TaxID=36090 RepID=A0A183BQ82_GLOPA